MELHSDFSKRVLIHGDAVPWTASPTAGVDRRMLDRIGEEVARATSFVRYAPGSAFPSHTHGGGEEFIVIDGVFQDERGDYPAGTYVRNPPTSHHRPGSAPGCMIFVKLWQFDPADRTAVTLDMDAAPPTTAPDRPGVTTRLLFSDAHETVVLENWAPGAQVCIALPKGAELLVLDGDCRESGDALQPLSWLRIPAGGTLDAVAGPHGTRVWIKVGGLRPASPQAWAVTP